MPFGPQNPFLSMEDDDIPLDTFGMDALFFPDKCCGLIAYADRELLAQLGEQDLRPAATERGGLLRRFTEDCETSQSIFSSLLLILQLCLLNLQP